MKGYTGVCCIEDVDFYVGFTIAFVVPPSLSSISIFVYRFLTPLSVPIQRTSGVPLL